MRRGKTTVKIGFNNDNLHVMVMSRDGRWAVRKHRAKRALRIGLTKTQAKRLAFKVAKSGSKIYIHHTDGRVQAVIDCA